VSYDFACRSAYVVVWNLFFSKLLFEVSPSDPTTFAGGTVLLFVVASVASFIPARRAATVDPVIALRHE